MRTHKPLPAIEPIRSEAQAATYEGHLALNRATQASFKAVTAVRTKVDDAVDAYAQALADWREKHPGP